jgi:hypothetical protein
MIIGICCSLLCIVLEVRAGAVAADLLFFNDSMVNGIFKSF